MMNMNMLAFFALLIGVFNTCSSAPSQSSATGSALTFDVNGISHRETRRVEGSIVTLTDAVDGFLVVLDYERDILMLKNLTSQTCFFSRLDNIPIMIDEEIPIFVQQVMENFGLETGGQNTDVLLLRQVGEIPFGYALLTNDATVAGKCSSQTSYWLEAKSISRQRRDDCDTKCTVEKVLIGVLIGFSLG